MPEISRFFGIVIYMFIADHEPPHFHAHYQGFKSAWSIEEASILAGSLPPRITRVVRRWAKENKKELIENWELCKNDEKPKRIPSF